LVKSAARPKRSLRPKGEYGKTRNFPELGGAFGLPSSALAPGGPHESGLAATKGTENNGDDIVIVAFVYYLLLLLLLDY
jgi:hypothetical protein